MNPWDGRGPPTALQAGILTFFLTVPNRDETTIGKPSVWKEI